jgi:hypothetical protein
MWLRKDACGFVVVHQGWYECAHMQQQVCVTGSAKLLHRNVGLIPNPRIEERHCDNAFTCTLGKDFNSACLALATERHTHA